MQQFAHRKIRKVPEFPAVIGIIVVMIWLWKKIRNFVWELKLGINTRGIQQIAEVVDNHYGTTDYDSIMATLHSLKMRPSDVFMDIGCGKGRVVCCAARFNIAEVIGVEIDPGLSQIALQNSQNVAGKRCRVKIINSAAQDADYHHATVLYLFHPFSAEILRRVLDRIRASLDSNPRGVALVYVHPVHKDVLASTAWLEQHLIWRQGRFVGMNNEISFWRSRLDATASADWGSCDLATWTASQTADIAAAPQGFIS